MHSEAEMFCFSASCRLLTPTGLAVRATSGEAVSRWFIFLDLRPWRSRQHIYNRSFLLIWLWGQGPSRDPTNQQKWGHTSRLVPSLKTFGICPLPESLQTRIIQQNNHYCLCRLFVRLFVPENLHLLHTGLESSNWRPKWGVEQSGRTGHWDGGRVSDVPWILAQHQHWEPRPPPTPSPALLFTCLVLEIRCSPFFFKVTWTQRQLELKLKYASQSWIRQGSGAGAPKRAELANRSLKETKAWVEYAHSSSYTVYNQEYIMGVCVYMARSLCFPLSLSPPEPRPGFGPYPVYPPRHYISQKTRS